MDYHASQQKLPLIPAERMLAEITCKGLILGLLLSMLLAAANAYIGLLVGLTVSASIPAAAVSMGVLRLFRKSNILENNMVQTSASAGEALVAGVIFTIPALVMMGAWEHYNFLPIAGIAMIGGFLGVAFTIPLRRALIVEAQLKYPEGIATAEVLKSGGIQTDRTRGKGKEKDDANQQASSGLKTLLEATGIGAVFKLFGSGFGWFAGSISTVNSWFAGGYLFFANINLSPALLGVGYIVGLNIASLVFIGGVIGTLIGVPLNWLLQSDQLMLKVGLDPAIPYSMLNADQWNALAGASWSSCRRIGVGAMIIGGIWSLISLFKPLTAGIKASMHAYRLVMHEGKSISRTEFDTPINYVLWGIALAMIPAFLIFFNVLDGYSGQWLIAVVMTAMLLIFGFLFSSVGGYMAGLVGSSNNPISGVTIATVIVSSLMLLQLMGNEGLAATLGPLAVIFLAGFICSAAAIAGDNMQDLKCGYLLGSTPWRQQIYQVIGVIGAALVIPFVLQVLDNGYGIGRPSPLYPEADFLAAPQAGLMRDLSTGIFGAGIEWGYIGIGCVLAVVLILLDEIQKKRGAAFRFPVLAVAVGIYLPLGLSVPIFIGGLIGHAMAGRMNKMDRTGAGLRERKGLLLASGLITGEALMGVLIAIVAAFIVPLPSTMGFGALSGLAAILGIVVYLYKRPLT